MRSRALALAVIGTSALAAGAAAAADAVPTYTAVYSVQYKGKDLGTSEFAVRYVAERDVYEFRSRTVVKGLLKLASPNPVIERSEFRVAGGRLQPLEFWYEDGSRKGEDNVHIAFDWDRQVAVVSADGGRREIRLEHGALDRGSLQVALMLDLESSGHPGRYLLADEDSIKSYEYVDSGAATTATGLGQLPTRAFMQQREGSSRSTWLWLAPELRYLPVRIEQRRDGEVHTAFTLESVDGLATAN
jgi:hypothetical protein